MNVECLRKIIAYSDKNREEIYSMVKRFCSFAGIEYDSDTDLVFCDCPGFFDNRGEIQDITNSFAICRVLSQAKNIKILLLASHPDIRATRGKALRECCQLVETLIPDQQSLRPAISLIITHVNQDDIDDANDSDGDGLLGNVELGRTGWLLKYFRDHEKSNKKEKVYNNSIPSRRTLKCFGRASSVACPQRKI